MLGIGGRTLAEAKANLSAEEVSIWASYRALRGPLSLGLRLEQLFAASDLRAAQIAGAKNIKITDLLRFHDSEEPEVVAESAQDIADFLKRFAN